MPCVTLTSDFGTVDGYVGAMKGVILSRAPGATVVDITHAIPRHDIAAGAFALATAVTQFPAGTIHVAVVDPGVGTTRAAVVVEANDQLFVAPDNGLLSLVAPSPVRAFAISSPEFCAARPSSTFHGRDVFATAAGCLAAGANPAEAGPALELSGALARLGDRVVIHIDAFGNLITNVRAVDLPPRPVIAIGDRRIEQLSLTYESVDKGELLAYVGSGETLEIAVREGNATELLGVGRGTPVEVHGADDA